MKKFLSALSIILCIGVLFCACNGENLSETTNDETQPVNTTADAESVTGLGNGANHFSFEVLDAEGNTLSYHIHTDKSTVGEALFELGIIDGEQGDYGLYVKSVNGIVADYDTDGAYWAFYINGNYASQSADLTEINENDVYSFRYEKG